MNARPETLVPVPAQIVAMVEKPESLGAWLIDADGDGGPARAMALDTVTECRLRAFKVVCHDGNHWWLREVSVGPEDM